MEFIYRATIQDDPDGGFVVTFADVPEAITAGETLTEAVTNAREALGLALRGIALAGRGLPVPQAAEGIPVGVDIDTAAKLALIVAFRESGISKTELANRLGRTKTEVQRILDPDHGTKIGSLQEALYALGQEIVVSVRKAA